MRRETTKETGAPSIAEFLGAGAKSPYNQAEHDDPSQTQAALQFAGSRVIEIGSWFFLGGHAPKNMKIFTSKAQQEHAIGTYPALRPSRASQGSPFHAAHRPGRCGILAAGSLDSATSIQHGIVHIGGI